MTAITTTERLGNYLDLFDDLGKRTKGQPAWLRTLREDAFARFCSTGFPTTRDEDWRFTNVSAIAQSSFQLSPDTHKISSADLQEFRMPGAACRLVFVNGRFVTELSDLGSLPKGVKVNGLAHEVAKNPGALESHLGRYTDSARD